MPPAPDTHDPAAHGADTHGADVPDFDTHHPTASSVWPAVIAAGLTLALFGLVVWTPAFGVVGVAALVWGVVGWVRELLDGSES
jgi:hypothetical protein